MPKISFRTKNLSRTILVVLGLILWLYALKHQLQHGWFDQSDLYPFLSGTVLIATALLPANTRINVIIFIALMICLEGISAMLLAISPQHHVADTTNENTNERKMLHVRDENMGHKLTANNSLLLRRYADDKLIYEYTATTDSFGRRVTPLPKHKKQDGFVAFFGASFTFGLGVNDDETLPYFVGAQLTEFKVYNYGVSAYGTQHLLALMDDRDFRKEIDADYGTGVYVFISDHVNRASYSLRRKASHHSPYYVLDEEDRAVRKGNFNSSHPVLFWLYRDVLSRSNLIELLQIDLPSIDDNDILRTCRLVDQSRHRFKKQFNKSEFYVIFHPSHYGNNAQYEEKLRACLEKSGIPYLDYSNQPWGEELNIPSDAHPNALGHRRFADMIAPQLRLAMEQLDGPN